MLSGLWALSAREVWHPPTAIAVQGAQRHSAQRAARAPRRAAACISASGNPSARGTPNQSPWPPRGAAVAPSHRGQVWEDGDREDWAERDYTQKNIKQLLTGCDEPGTAVCVRVLKTDGKVRSDRARASRATRTDGAATDGQGGDGPPLGSAPAWAWRAGAVLAESESLRPPSLRRPSRPRRGRVRRR
jgi:hypothetical protein